jgi:predicted nucleic acid-binding protein
MYLVFRAGGFSAQAAFWQLRSANRLLLHDSTAAEIDRMIELMDKYQDLPMDLADASLIAAAEALTTRRVFTLDNDLRIYRFADGSAVDVVP